MPSTSELVFVYEPMAELDSYSSCKEPFDILLALLNHNDEALMIVEYLSPQDVESIYAVSKVFRQIFENDKTRFMRVLVNNHAYYAYETLPLTYDVNPPLFKYQEDGKDLTIDTFQYGFNPNTTPCFKWLKIAAHRHRISEHILYKMDQHGIRFPQYMLCTIQKIWFTMSWPLNTTRADILRNDQYWTDNDLMHALLLFVKMDQLFNCPIKGTGELSLRKLILGQPSLRLFHQILMNHLSNLSIIRHAVRYNLRPFNFDHGESVFGISANKVCLGCLEAWGKGSLPALTVDKAVMKECRRRGLSPLAILWELSVYDRRISSLFPNPFPPARSLF